MIIWAENMKITIPMKRLFLIIPSKTFSSSRILLALKKLLS
jgi:hypothetical protein